MVKTDGVQRGLIGEIIKRFEQKGYRLVALKLMKVCRCLAALALPPTSSLLSQQPSLELVRTHYQDLSSKGFYDGLCKFMSSGPVCAMVRAPPPHPRDFQWVWPSCRCGRG